MDPFFSAAQFYMSWYFLVVPALLGGLAALAYKCVVLDYQVRPKIMSRRMWACCVLLMVIPLFYYVFCDPNASMDKMLSLPAYLLLILFTTIVAASGNVEHPPFLQAWEGGIQALILASALWFGAAPVVFLDLLGKGLAETR